MTVRKWVTVFAFITLINFAVIFIVSNLMVNWGKVKSLADRECVGKATINNWEKITDNTKEIIKGFRVELEKKDQKIKEAEGDAKHWKDSYFYQRDQYKKQEEIIN